MGGKWVSSPNINKYFKSEYWFILLSTNSFISLPTKLERFNSNKISDFKITFVFNWSASTTSSECNIFKSSANSTNSSGANIKYSISLFLSNFKISGFKISGIIVGDLITGNVVKGKPDMKHTVVKGVIVRQKQEFKRPDGTTIKFESNGLVVLKDEKSGSPKGTVIKGAIGKEVGERFPAVARIANVIV